MTTSVDAARAARRRELLGQYLVEAALDGVVSWADLVKPGRLDALLRTISGDLPAVLTQLGRKQSAGLLRMLGHVVNQIADSVATPRPAREPKRKRRGGG